MKAIKIWLGAFLAAMICVGIIATPGLGTKKTQAAIEHDVLYVTDYIDLLNDKFYEYEGINIWSDSLSGKYNLICSRYLVFKYYDSDGNPKYLDANDTIVCSEGASIRPSTDDYVYENGKQITVWISTLSAGPGDYTFTYNGHTVTYHAEEIGFGVFYEATLNYTKLVSTGTLMVTHFEGMSRLYAVGVDEFTVDNTVVFYDEKGNTRDGELADIFSTSDIKMEIADGVATKTASVKTLTPVSSWPAKYKDCSYVRVSFMSKSQGYILDVFNDPVLRVTDAGMKTTATSSGMHLEYGSAFCFFVLLDEYNENYPNAILDGYKVGTKVNNNFVELDVNDYFNVTTMYEFPNQEGRPVGYRFDFKEKWPEKDIDYDSIEVQVFTKNAGDNSISVIIDNPTEYPEVGIYDTAKLHSKLYVPDYNTDYNGDTDVYYMTYYPGREFYILRDNQDTEIDDNQDTKFNINAYSVDFENGMLFDYNNELNANELFAVCYEGEDDSLCRVSFREWPNSLKNLDKYALVIKYQDVTGENKNICIIVTKALWGFSGMLDDSIAMNVDWRIDDRLLNEADSYIRVEVDNVVTDYSFDVIKKEKLSNTMNYCSSEVRLAACQMNDNIKITLYCHKEAVLTYNLTFADYAKKVKDTYKGSYLEDLIDATLNYGDYARRYFNHNLNANFNNVYANSENSIMDQYTAAKVKEDIEAKYPEQVGFITKSNISNNVEVIGISLTCRDRVAFNLYLETKGDKSASAICLVEGPENTIVKAAQSNVCKVTMADISVWNLGTVQKITLNTGKGDSPSNSEEYLVNPIEYFYLTMNSNNEALVNLSRAMYIYYLAGNEYMAHSR